ncbi:Sds3-like-domain-containing protein [Halteromyces radiatus]|uniref:Sds3-like-domain-containing protein n=1 Tax=Halteromyces radiatus TaxID=101107 RepID=UPI0022200DC8|nr:Sds3-like-domain-containing protein [Halteromyces radiatus]KAI8092466.1 Sds3-like-domain-containing protein [Halteromyces radiatus]
MPLASMLETNKPFIFTSHSNGSSTELPSPTNKSTLQRPVHNSTTNHTKLPSPSPVDRGLYYSSSSVSKDLDSQQETSHQPHMNPHYQNQQTSRPNGYIYPTTTSTPKTPHEDIPSYSNQQYQHSSPTIPANTPLPPPSSLTPTSTSPSTTSATTSSTIVKVQQSLSFSSPPPTGTHQVSSLSSPTLNDNRSSQVSHQVLPPMDHHQLGNVKMEDSEVVSFNSTSHLTAPHLLTSSPPALSTSTTLPKIGSVPLSTPTTTTPNNTTGSLTAIVTSEPILTSTKTIAQDEEVDSGYFDSSATDNKRVKRRKELNQRIEYLNNDFIQNKERIFSEKLLATQNEISQAHNNTHRQYKEGLILLESIRQKTIEDGRLLRDYQTQVTDKQFTLEIHRAEEEYLAEKHEVREKLFAVLEEKRRRLKEEKDNCDLAYDVVMESQTRMNKRSLRKRGMDNGDNKLNKRKQVSGPTLIFRLKDEEVFDDLQAMRNGLTNQVKKPTSHKKK